MLVGAAIGSKVKNYWAIFILAIISHFILDAIPHWEYAGLAANASGDAFIAVTVKALIDILIGISIIGWLFKSSPLARLVIWGAFFALLPDGLVFTYALAQVFFGWQLTFLAGPIAFHNIAHYTDGLNLLFWRIIAEVIIATASFFVLWQTRQTVKRHK